VYEDFVVVLGVAGDFEGSSRCRVEIWIYWSCGKGGVFGVPTFGLRGGNGRSCSWFLASVCLGFSVVSIVVCPLGVVRIVSLGTQMGFHVT